MPRFRVPDVSPKLLLLGLAGILLILIGNFAASGDSLATKGTSPPQEAPRAEATSLESYRDSLRREAERVLGQIRGAGTVVVSVSVGSGPETVVAANRSESVRQTEERDATSGGTRITEEHSTTVQPVMARQVTAGDGPVVTRVVAPEVEGVLVVASGASNPAVRAEIFRAVQILFNVAPHRVQVLPMKAGE